MALAAFALGLNTYSVSARVTFIAGAAYLVALVWTGADAYLNRRARDYVPAEIVWSLFDGLNRDFFASDPGATFTLFRVPPFGKKNCIVPWYRYRLGGSDAISEADSSCARYTRGESITGDAWAKPGVLQYEVFPIFRTENEFRTYYKDELKLRTELVDSLNPRMQKVRTILAYGFVTNTGSLLGVLSLDLERVASVDGKFASTEGAIHIESRALLSMLFIIRDVLQALSKIEGVDK